MNSPIEPPNQPFFIVPADVNFIERWIEPAAQKIQRFVGLDCFFWGTIAFWISLIFAVVNILLFSVTIAVSLHTGKFSNVLLGGLCLWVLITLRKHTWHNLTCHDCGIRAQRKLAYEMLVDGYKNPFLFQPRNLLLTALLMILITITEIGFPWQTILVIALFKAPFVAGYIGQALCSCTPLPPGKSKLRQAWEAGKLWLASATAPATPMPEPNGA